MGLGLYIGMLFGTRHPLKKFKNLFRYVNAKLEAIYPHFLVDERAERYKKFADGSFLLCSENTLAVRSSRQVALLVNEVGKAGCWENLFVI